jgi:hypothetical protein
MKLPLKFFAQISFKHFYAITITLFFLNQPSAQAQDFKWIRSIKNQKGIVKVFSEDAVVIIAEGKDSERYASSQLPTAWKQDGLHLTFSGKVGEIPPNIRMIGTPLKLSCISTTAQEAQKFKLSKTKIKFK